MNVDFGIYEIEGAICLNKEFKNLPDFYECNF